MGNEEKQPQKRNRRTMKQPRSCLNELSALTSLDANLISRRPFFCTQRIRVRPVPSHREHGQAASRCPLRLCGYLRDFISGVSCLPWLPSRLAIRQTEDVESCTPRIRRLPWRFFPHGSFSSTPARSGPPRAAHGHLHL